MKCTQPYCMRSATWFGKVDGIDTARCPDHAPFDWRLFLEGLREWPWARLGGRWGLWLFLIAALLLMLIAAGVSVRAEGLCSGWTPTDRTGALLMTAATALDWAQTRDFTGLGQQELNPALGRHPRPGDVNGYFAALLAAQWTIACLLPPAYRGPWLWFNAGLETEAVNRNYRLGVTMGVNLRSPF